MGYEPNIESGEFLIRDQKKLKEIIDVINGPSSFNKLSLALDYEGELILPNSILINHKDLEIKGRGKDVTTIVVDDGFVFKDDCIIGVTGNAVSDDDRETPVSVKISDLTIKSRVSRSVYDDADKKTPFVTGCYAVKIYCASSVDIHSVRIHVEDIACTNIDIRNGKNINIYDCEFVNYNRQKTGGVLWFRGDLQNLRVHHNVIRKYGNDEALGIWSVNNYVGVSDGREEVRKEGIYVTDNEFYNEIAPYSPSVDINPNLKTALSDASLGADDGWKVDTGIIGSWDGAIDRFVAVFTNQDDNLMWAEDGTSIFRPTPARHIVSDVHIDGNDFYMNAPVKNAVTFVFDAYTEYQNISFNGNKMIYKRWPSGILDTNKIYGPIDVNVLYDVCYEADNELDAINSYSGYCDTPVEVCRNLFRAESQIATNADSEFHACVVAQGTKVVFSHNVLDYSYKVGYTLTADFARAGYVMLFGTSKSFSVVAKDNWAVGLRALLIASGGSKDAPIANASLEAIGNHLGGDTRISTMNVSNASYCLNDNSIKSDYELCMLVEQASNQTVSMSRNVVTRNVFNPSRSRVFAYDAGYAGVKYDRCLFLATENRFLGSNSADVEDAEGVFSRFPQSQSHCLYAVGNTSKADDGE